MLLSFVLISMKTVIAYMLLSSPWAMTGYACIALLGLYALIRHYLTYKEKQAWEERTRFFIQTAHDLRTPLTLIKVSLEEMAQREPLSKEGRTQIGMALKHVDALTRHTANLINLGRSDIAHTPLRLSENELTSYLEETVQAFRPYADTKHIRLSLQCNFPKLNVWFDREKMESIVKNILSNALKYTPEGGEVRITVSEEADAWNMEVSDTGIGIPAKEQKKIFRRHFRGSNAINSKISGSGIGLLLVWRQVHIHKGTIRMESVENKGTSIKVSFPKDRAAYPSAFIESTPTVVSEVSSPTLPATYKDMSHRSEREHPRILVVEDNDDLRTYLTNALNDTHVVQTSTNGKEALACITDFKPELILSDILMPEMRGDELCTLVKNNIETSHIPVILLTALSDDQSIMEGLHTGADRYIVKPFNIGVLKAAIANLLTNRALLRSKYAEMELHEKDEKIDYGNALDNEFLESVKRTIEAHLTDTDFHVDTLSNTLNMSRSSFYNKLKALTNHAPADYIRLIRLKHAAQLLSQGKYNVTEVADKTGFNDAKYFREVFKKYYKVSPSAYSKATDS